MSEIRLLGRVFVNGRIRLLSGLHIGAGGYSYVLTCHCLNTTRRSGHINTASGCSKTNIFIGLHLNFILF